MLWLQTDLLRPRKAAGKCPVPGQVREPCWRGNVNQDRFIEYEVDTCISKIMHLCSIDGILLKSISWDSQKELVVFPRS